jgi:hypothetical protein
MGDDQRRLIKSLTSRISESRPRGARRLSRAIIFVGALGSLSVTPQAHCAVSCKPIIAIKSVQISEPRDMKRGWTAVLDVSAFFCATSFGRFEIDFIRQKENAPDVQFTEQFEWRPGEIAVSLELWWDETVSAYRIGFVAPCVCREWQF